MPTRDAATDNSEDICDLDVIVSRSVTFTFRNRKRELLPITTERLFAFWAAGISFRKAEFNTAEEANAAFFEIIKTVCADLTLKEASEMTVVQKGALLELVTRKITGQESLGDSLKKKVVDKPSS